jgi:hypothetical protein
MSGHKNEIIKITPQESCEVVDMLHKYLDYPTVTFEIVREKYTPQEVLEMWSKCDKYIYNSDSDDEMLLNFLVMLGVNV